MQLNSAQTKQLKSLAHPLKPVVRMGQKGLTDAVIAEIELALDHHELIKVKLAGGRDERDDVVSQIIARTQSERIALTGGIVVLYRQHPEAPKINLQK